MLTFLDAAEAVYRAQNKYRFVLAWAVGTSLWILATLLPLVIVDVFDLGPVGAFILDTWFYVLFVGLVVFAYFSPFALYWAWKASQTLNGFLKDFYPLWYKVRFEMLPAGGANVDEQLFNKLGELHPGLRKAEVAYGVDVPGRHGSHHFTVLAKSRSVLPPVPFPRQMALVRRFASETPTSRAELEKLKEDALDCTKKTGILKVLVAISPVGFESDAVEWARSKDGLPTKNVVCSLLTYRDEQFSVVWAAYGL